MKKKTVFASLAILSAAAVTGIVPLFAQSTRPSPAPKYISPNNDGVQDTLVIPLRIAEKERYLSEWKLVVKDQSGAEVRTIGNKETRPASMTFKTFWKILFTPKKGVPVPDSVMWDGTLDSGDVAPDGVYTYSVAASDDNGNTSASREYTVVVDNTPPEIDVRQPSAADKFFGEGAKSTIRIAQTGSEEDIWNARITDTSGKVVWSREWRDSAPSDVSWDGKDNSGAPVADGVYNYEINSIDLAGNISEPAKVTNIIYSAVKPLTNIAINGSRYFSPGTGSKQNQIVFDLTVPQPASGNTLVSWKVEVLNNAGVVQRSFPVTGTDKAPAQVVFDGKNIQGTMLGDGDYFARLQASYRNGYETPYVRTGAFTLDRNPPSAEVKLVSDALFAPGGAKGSVTLSQQLSEEATTWRGEVFASSGTVVRSVDLGAKPAASFVWNGLDNNGKLCADGDYKYRVTNTDLAGNATSAESVAFTLDTSTTEVMLTVQPPVFSPNGDKVQDTLTLTPVVKASSGVASYTLTIQNAQKTVVKTYQDERAVPNAISWDGKTDSGQTAADGVYTATLKTVARSGTASEPITSEPFTIDTVFPQVSVSVPYTLFSPDGISRKQNLPLTVKTSAEQLWEATITAVSGANAGKAVRTFAWYNESAQLSEWDARDDSGNKVPDGVYRFMLSAVDAGGNKASAVIDTITVDSRPATAWVTAEYDVISPNPSAKTRTQNFTTNVSLKDGAEDWSFTVSPATVGLDGVMSISGEPVKTWRGAGDTIPAAFTWDGKTDGGASAEGSFAGVLKVYYKKGNDVEADTSPFVCSAQPPDIGVSSSPEYFSPDNDGENDELYISLRARSFLPFASWNFTIFNPEQEDSRTHEMVHGKAFWATSGRSTITPQIVWGGKGNAGDLVQSAMDYPYEFTVTDTQGLTSTVTGKIPIDVLVIRDGNKLRMQIPAITFRADNADFKTNAEEKNGITQAQYDNNVRVLKRVAEILGKFRDYSVTIEGHANGVYGTEAEETSTTVNGQTNIPLVPLSLDRANFVKQELVKLGVSGSRLSTEGIGGRRRIASLSDRDNWWKNRRVEFILNK